MAKPEFAEIKAQIAEKQNVLQGELGELDANTFNYLKDEVCGDLDGKSLKECDKVVKANIKQLTAEAKEEVKKIREEIKELRALMKERGNVQKDAIANVKKNIGDYADEYIKYKESLFYSLKQKCAVKVSGKTALIKYIDEHPTMEEFNRQLAHYNEKIEELHNNLKVDVAKHSARIDKLKRILRTDLSALEKSVITMTLKEEKKHNKVL